MFAFRNTGRVFLERSLTLNSLAQLDVTDEIFLKIIACREFSLLGLFIIGVGTGGIKPCVSAFGGEQFVRPQQDRQLEQFFSYFYISINAGSLISTLLTPILREDVQCFGQNSCFPLAFGVPAILMIIAIGNTNNIMAFQLVVVPAAKSLFKFLFIINDQAISYICRIILCHFIYILLNSLSCFLRRQMELQNATHRGQHHGGRIQVYCCEFLYYSSTNLKRATATLIERSIRLVRSDPNNLLNQSKYISVTFNAFFFQIFDSMPLEGNSRAKTKLTIIGSISPPTNSISNLSKTSNKFYMCSYSIFRFLFSGLSTTNRLFLNHSSFCFLKLSFIITRHIWLRNRVRDGFSKPPAWTDL